MNISKIGIVAALVLAGVAAWYLERRVTLRLREENSALQEEVRQVTERVKLAARREPAAAPGLSQEQLQELVRLRGQVGVLKAQLAEALKAKASVSQPPPAPVREDPDAQEKQRAVGIAKLNFTKNWMLAFYLHADKHEGNLPTSFEEASAFLSDEAKNQGQLEAEGFEIVFQGSMRDIANPASAFIIREKLAWQGVDGSWYRAYGFADGHSEIHRSADGNFDAWEAGHAPKLRSAQGTPGAGP